MTHSVRYPQTLDMTHLLAPRSIAVVGASANPMAIGGQPIRQLIRHNFAGKIYPVNPNRDEVQGLQCFASVADLPLEIDVAIIALAAQHVIGTVEECARKGIPFAVILSSGFADAGEDGVRLQQRLLRTSKENGIRILGPNCVGYISVGHSLYAGFGAFFEYHFTSGSVSFVTQSGGVGGALLTVLDEEGVGFRHFVHTGNAVDLDIETMLDAFLDDPGTQMLLAYIEGLADNSRFAQVAARALREEKPLIAWKAGKFNSSSNAVISHTGRLAGDIERYRAIFDHHGVIEVDDSADLSDVLKLTKFGCQPGGDRVGIVSVSGGSGVIAADCLAEAKNLYLADFDQKTVKQISALLPTFATSQNPVDVTAQIFNQPELFERVVVTLSEQAEVDIIVACIASVHGEIGERIAKAISDTQKSVDIPIIAVWASREELNAKAFRLLREARIPLFRTPERALRALDRVAVIPKAKQRLVNTTTKVPHPSRSLDPRGSWHRTTEIDILESLSGYGVTIPRYRLVHSASEAATAIREMGGKVVMKVMSPDIHHKVDVGGVRLGILKPSEAAQAYNELVKAGEAVADAEIRGVIVQQTAGPGVEVICGYVRDPVLGNFLLCGSGGSKVEELHDVQLLPMPASRDDILAALTRVRAYKGLSQFPQGTNALVDLLGAVQQLISDNEGRLKELEINPVIVTAENAIAVDALVVENL